MCNPRRGKKRPVLTNVQSEAYGGYRALGQGVFRKKKRFILSDVDMVIAPRANLSGHVPIGSGMKKFLESFLVFFYLATLFLASHPGYRWRKEDKFLPASEHCTSERQVEESLVRNITFYFLTLLWSTNPLVLYNNFSCSIHLMIP